MDRDDYKKQLKENDDYEDDYFEDDVFDSDIDEDDFINEVVDDELAALSEVDNLPEVEEDDDSISRFEQYI
jgi:hypothetical protein